MTGRTAAAPSARRDAAAEHDRQVPTIVAPPVLDDEVVADHAARVREAIPGTVVVVNTTSRTGVERTRRSVFLTLSGAENAVERALARGHEVAVVAVKLVPLLALLALAATTPDVSVRRAYLAVIRSPRAAFVDPFLTRSAAKRRARIAAGRGWSARVIPVDLVAVDGSSLDPLDLDDPVETAPAPRPRRRSRRSTHARLDRAEAAAVAGVVVELDGDEDLDEVVR